MAINSLNETKTLLRVADFLGVKPGASKPAGAAGGQTQDNDKIDGFERAKDPSKVPTPPASGF